MNDIVQMSKGGTNFYPKTKVQAVLGLQDAVGTNLLINSNFSSGLDHWAVNGDLKAIVTTDSDGDRCVHLTATGNGGGLWCGTVPFNQNQITTGSVLVKGIGVLHLVGLEYRPTSNFGTISSESYSKVSTTSQASSNTNNFVVSFDAVNGVLDVYIKFAKLEKGPTATDWCPNPLEIATDRSVQTAIANALDKVATINVISQADYDKLADKSGVYFIKG